MSSVEVKAFGCTANHLLGYRAGPHGIRADDWPVDKAQLPLATRSERGGLVS